MKRTFTDYKLAFLIALFLSTGCGTFLKSNAQLPANNTFQTDIKLFPALPAAQRVEDGIVVYKIRLNKDDEASDVWIYLPEKLPKEKLSVILIAAAGSYLWNGAALGNGDQPEHLPYVRKGYAVIAYETPGNLEGVNLEQITDKQFLTAVNDFKKSNAGLMQEQNALNYALDKVTSIDPERVYAAGHSSAATLSLLVAANDARIKAAIAYAPATDIEKKLAEVIPPFEKAVPGFKDFIIQNSPKNNVSKIKIPVFIFQATDDSVIPVEDTKIFVSELQKVNSNVTFITVNTGDHYDSMIQEGVPKAIEWLNKIAFGSKKK